MHNGVKPILNEYSNIYIFSNFHPKYYVPQISRENTGAEKYIWMFLQKVSLPIVSGMYATAHRITDTTSIYYSGFLLTWFRWKNSYSCLTVSNITLKVLLNVDHLKTHNMRLKTVRQKFKLSTRSFRNEKTKKQQLEEKNFNWSCNSQKIKMKCWNTEKILQMALKLHIV